MTKGKKIFIGLFLTALVVAFGFAVFRKTDSALGAVVSDWPKFAGDVIGSRSVTTTVGVNFANPSVAGNLTATTSYASKIGGNRAVAIYTIKIVDASTTSFVSLDVQGSNDYNCETTATSGGNEPLVPEIQWFSAGEHLNNRVHSTSFTNATSSAAFAWANPTISAGNEIVLTNLSYECLRLNIRGASTTLWAQLRTR